MKDEELMRRISDALDAPGGLEADADLRALLDDDEDASLYALDVQAIDEALSGLAAKRAEPDWDTMFDAIEARLDGDVDAELAALGSIGDPTLAPVFDGEEGEETFAPVVAPQESRPVAQTRPAEVVDLAARRKRQQLFATIGGLAAAAAVGLGIIVGLDSSPDAPMAGLALQEEASAVSSATPEPTAPPASAAADTAPAAEAPAEAEAEPMAEEVAEYAMPAPPQPVAAPMAATGTRSAGDSLGVMGARSVAGGGGGMGGGRSGAGAPSLGAGPADRVNPTRAEVVNALNAVASAVQRCISDTDQLARVHVRVNGSSGRIESATVAPPYTGTEAACVIRAVRTAQMPRSAHPSYEVDHLYHPAPIAAGSLRPGNPAARRQRRARPTRPPATSRSLEVMDAFAE